MMTQPSRAEVRQASAGLGRPCRSARVSSLWRGGPARSRQRRRLLAHRASGKWCFRRGRETARVFNYGDSLTASAIAVGSVHISSLIKLYAAGHRRYAQKASEYLITGEAWRRHTWYFRWNVMPCRSLTEQINWRSTTLRPGCSKDNLPQSMTGDEDASCNSCRHSSHGYLGLCHGGPVRQQVGRSPEPLR